MLPSAAIHEGLVMKRIRQILGLVLALAASSASAQGTISNGNVNFIRNASSFDATPVADFNGVSPVLTQDHVFEAGWAFRVAGDSCATSCLGSSPGTARWTPWRSARLSPLIAFRS